MSDDRSLFSVPPPFNEPEGQPEPPSRARQGGQISASGSLNGGTATTHTARRMYDSLDALTLDHLPTCPHCGDLVSPPWRSCCGRPLFLSQYQLDLMFQARIESEG